MPPICLSLFPSSATAFSLSCSPSPLKCPSNLSSFTISESYKANVYLLQSITFFHGHPPSKMLQVLAFCGNSKISSNLDIGEDSQFQESSAINRDIQVKMNVLSLGFSGSGEAPRSDSEKVDTCFLGRAMQLGMSNDVNIFAGVQEKEQYTGSLLPWNFVGLGRRRRRFYVHDLVKKIVRLPDEERAKVLDIFNFDGTQVTVSEYNDILIALVRAGEYESAVTLFSDISSRGLSPDLWTLSTMIQCFCKKNDPDRAYEVLDAMLQNGLHPDTYTFTGLISCLGKRGRLNKIYEVFDIMDRIGCELTVRNYNSLIYGLCNVGKVEEALQLLGKIKKRMKGPDIYSFNYVMDGFSKVGRTDEAKKLLKDALKFGLIPTNASYTCLFKGYCKERRPLKALHLLKEMERRDLEPDVISYNTLLNGLLKQGEIQAALATYKKLRGAGFQVDDRSMNTLIRGLCRQSMINGEHLEEAKVLFDEVTCKGIGSSPYTYCLMVQTLAESGDIDASMSYLTEMYEDMYLPRIMTYNVVLRILCRKGRFLDALDVLIIMIKRGTMPSKFSLSILIDLFNKQGRLLDSFAVYSVAIKLGIVPNHKPRRILNI